MRRKLLLWLPFALGLALLAAFYINLRNPGDRVIASQMVGKTLPEFAAPPAFPGQDGVSSASYLGGKPRLINVFASWCIPCVQEIPVLLQLKQMGAPIDGIAVHDTREKLAGFIADNGNPYARIGLDDHGRFQVGIGSAGVPETFVVDGQGKILHQHIGVVMPDDVPRILGMLELPK
jgi:cytochrome c biogenesis protein CcmG, thiol:disulfide interchange protein DsbE